MGNHLAQVYRTSLRSDGPQHKGQILWAKFLRGPQMVEADVKAKAAGVAGNLGSALNFGHERCAFEVNLGCAAAVAVIHRQSAALDDIYLIVVFRLLALNCRVVLLIRIWRRAWVRRWICAARRRNRAVGILWWVATAGLGADWQHHRKAECEYYKLIFHVNTPRFCELIYMEMPSVYFAVFPNPFRRRPGKSDFTNRFQIYDLPRFPLP